MLLDTEGKMMGKYQTIGVGGALVAPLFEESSILSPGWKVEIENRDSGNHPYSDDANPYMF